MTTPVVVIVGAGASYVSGDFADEDRPPLTTQLFHTKHALPLLRLYRLAQAAGIVIDRQIRADDTVAFEAALRQLQEDGHAHHQQMALAVPPFLQALLLRYSELWHADAHRYGVLVDELLKLRTKVMVVSLNYDTLLDNHLAAFSSLVSMHDYIDTSRTWSLIKPHGSVCWYVEQPEPFDPKTPPADLLVVEEPIECVPTNAFDLRAVRSSHMDDAHGLTSRYPAIALPNGEKDRLVLPAQHLEHLNYTLAAAPDVDVLVLGYSAIDNEVLALIKNSGCEVRRLTVVNASPTANLEVFTRLQAFGIEPIWPDVVDGSYASWIDGDGISNWVREYDGPFRSAVEPTELKRRIDVREYESHQRGRSVSWLDEPL